jgi:hypothetical protein
MSRRVFRGFFSHVLLRVSECVCVCVCDIVTFAVCMLSKTSGVCARVQQVCVGARVRGEGLRVDWKREGLSTN